MSFTEQVGELFEKEGFHVQNLFLSGDSELWEAQYFGDHEILMIAFGGKGMECAERHLSPSISRLTKKGDLKEFIFNKEEREEFLRELPDVFPPLP